MIIFPILLFIIGMTFLFIIAGLRMDQEYQRGVIFRLGRYKTDHPPQGREDGLNQPINYQLFTKSLTKVWQPYTKDIINVMCNFL